jgi:hypothetical protein
VVSFCTGGIRCEKAALWMVNDGMDNVLQLDGGILGYFEEVGGEATKAAASCSTSVALDAELADGRPAAARPQRVLTALLSAAAWRLLLATKAAEHGLGSTIRGLNLPWGISIPPPSLAAAPAAPMQGDPVTEKRLMIPLSILDLAPVCEGSDTTAAFANMLDWRSTPMRWATAATGWPNTTTCPASPVPPPPC